MTKDQLIKRNKQFIIEVITLLRELPNDRVYDSLVRQLVRSSTSVGANYRAACRAKSSADFINKLKIVEEEADECSFFLDVLFEKDNGKNKSKIEKLLQEANELVSIYVASLKTMRTKSELVNRKS